MPRSNRRCAISLHDVGKWTVPRRWSLSSWLKTGTIETAEKAATAVKPANKALIMGSSLARVYARCNWQARADQVSNVSWAHRGQLLYIEFSSAESERPRSPTLR